LVKIGTTQAQKKLFYKIGKVRKALESNQENKYELLAKDLHVPKGDIVEMEQRMYSRDLSLDSTFDKDHELTHLASSKMIGSIKRSCLPKKRRREFGNKKLGRQ
jgi:RNA polymerase sigma-32 factor